MCLALSCLQAVAQGTHRVGVLGCLRCTDQAFCERWIMRLTSTGNIGTHIGFCTSDHIVFAVVARIGGGGFDLAELFGQLSEFIEGRNQLLFVVGLLAEVLTHNQATVPLPPDLAVISLFKTTTGYRHDARFFIGEVDLIFALRTRRGRFRCASTWLLPGLLFLCRPPGHLLLIFA